MHTKKAININYSQSWSTNSALCNVYSGLQLLIKSASLFFIWHLCPACMESESETEKDTCEPGKGTCRH